MDVFFDFDSTIISIESLDELIGRALTTNEQRNAIYKITEQGMNGDIDFNTSLKLRLNTVQLTKTMVLKIAEELPMHFTNGITNFIKDLQKNGHTVHILTGGFVDYLLPAATALGISKKHLHGNTLMWNGDTVTGFDESAILAHAGGKADAIKALNLNWENVVMVGDGSTDLEAYEQKAAAHFVGFGEHAVRTRVIKNAPHFVYSVNELKEIFKKIEN